MKPLFVYRAIPPDGRRFHVAVVELANGTCALMASRNGAAWKPYDELAIADVLMPEFELNEWTFVVVHDLLTVAPFFEAA